MPYLEREDRLLVIIGPPGAGETGALQLLHDQGVIEVTPVWTTRPPRQGEASGTLEHHFADEAAFMEKKGTGYFLASARISEPPYWYGLPKLKKPPGSRVAAVIVRSGLLPLIDKCYTNYALYQIGGAEAGRARRLFANEGPLEDLAGRIAAALIEDRLVGPEV